MKKNETWSAGLDLAVTRVLGGRSGAFLVSSPYRHMLVDTGAPRDRATLLSRLGALGVESIDWLVLTHSHYDHAGNAKVVRERFGAKVVIARAEREALESGRNDADGIIPVGTNAVMRFLTDAFSNAIRRSLVFEPCPADVALEGAHDFSGEGLDALVVPTPGHTVGSVSVIAKSAGDPVALVGDAMFGVFPGSIFPPFAWNVPLLRESWGILLGFPCETYICAHGSANARALVEREFARIKGNAGKKGRQG
jgi:glyoxylase-like metal-dependent hydrolase (beta-lactamase superfamily II)